MTGGPWLDMSHFAGSGTDSSAEALDQLTQLFQAALDEASARVDPERWQAMLFVAIAPPDVLEVSRSAFDDWPDGAGTAGDGDGGFGGAGEDGGGPDADDGPDPADAYGPDPHGLDAYGPESFLQDDPAENAIASDGHGHDTDDDIWNDHGY